MGCLEWDLGTGNQDSLCYVLRKGPTGFLKKIALNATRSENLMAVLQSAIPHANGNLQELYLSLEFSVTDAELIDWSSVFVVLQQCKQLQVLHIFLWESGWYDPAIILDCSKLPKPFQRLRDLSLFGFAVASSALDSFLATFPTLETLEVQVLEGLTYSLSSVKQAVLWDDQIGDLDGQDSTCKVVPRSLKFVVGLLGSDDSGIKEKALKKLVDLSYYEMDFQSVIASAPGCMLKLVNLLKGQKESVQKEALIILQNLVADDKEVMTIVAFPGLLKQVINLVGSESLSIKERATYLLGTFTAVSMVSLRALVQSDPEVLKGLVNLLGDKSKDVQQIAARALAQLVDSHGISELIVAIPGCLEKLGSMLESKHALVQDSAAWCLQRLAASDYGHAIARVPGCLEGLVNMLGSRIIFLKKRAARAVCSLAEDSRAGQRLQRVPKFWRRLVRLLDPSMKDLKQQVYEDAVSVLAHVGVDAEAMEAVASLPGALQMMVNVLGSKKMVTREHAVRVLDQMTDDMEIRKAIAAVPGILQKLSDCIRNNEDAEGIVRGRAAELFQKLQ